MMRRYKIYKIFKTSFVVVCTLSILLSNTLFGAAIRPSGLGEAGVRVIGMGEAFVGLSDDANAVFWNPAGLAFMNKMSKHFATTIKANDRDSTTYDALAVAAAYSQEQEVDEVDSIKDILSNPEILENPTKKKVYSYVFGLGFISSEQNKTTEMRQVTFGVADTLKSSRLSWGIKVRHVNYSNYLNEHGKYTDFTETALGIGLLYKLTDKINIGVVADNIIKDSPYDLPTLITVGFGVKVDNSLSVDLDIFNITNEDSTMGDLQFRAGLEKRFVNDSFAIRVGTKNGNLNLGFGVRISDTFYIDYAFLADYDTDLTQHFIGGSIKF